MNLGLRVILLIAAVISFIICIFATTHYRTGSRSDWPASPGRTSSATWVGIVRSAHAGRRTSGASGPLDSNGSKDYIQPAAQNDLVNGKGST